MHMPIPSMPRITPLRLLYPLVFLTTYGFGLHVQRPPAAVVPLLHPLIEAVAPAAAHYPGRSVARTASGEVESVEQTRAIGTAISSAPEMPTDSVTPAAYGVIPGEANALTALSRHSPGRPAHRIETERDGQGTLAASPPQRAAAAEPAHAGEPNVSFAAALAAPANRQRTPTADTGPVADSDEVNARDSVASAVATGPDAAMTGTDGAAEQDTFAENPFLPVTNEPQQLAAGCPDWIAGSIGMYARHGDDADWYFLQSIGCDATSIMGRHP
jgi:hypothetical protein